jgi:hypothetical protein
VTETHAHRALQQALPALVLSACIGNYPQRVPGPLVLPVAPAAETNADETPGAERSGSPAVTVQRDSDPVWVRRPGERGDYGLPFYQKRERVPAGTLVRTGAGGRAELLWAPDATSLAMFDEGRVTLGDPARDEPVLRFHSVTRALLVLTPEDRVELLGGANLEGDSLNTTGPILLESVPGSILRVTNQSKRLSRVRYRTENLELGPGESIDLPVLASGTEPREEATEAQTLLWSGLPVSFRGRVERREENGGVSLTALEPALVTGLGIEVRLGEQETIRFSGLSPGPGEAAEPPIRP